MDRRKFLRMFGVGATVVPIVGAGTVPVAARIVEPPKVEIADVAVMKGEWEAANRGFGGLIGAHSNPATVTITISYDDPLRKNRMVFTTHGVLLDAKTDFGRYEVDVTDYGDTFRKFLTVPDAPQEWRITLVPARGEG